MKKLKPVLLLLVATAMCCIGCLTVDQGAEAVGSGKLRGKSAQFAKELQTNLDNIPADRASGYIYYFDKIKETANYDKTESGKAAQYVISVPKNKDRYDTSMHKNLLENLQRTLAEATPEEYIRSIKSLKNHSSIPDSLVSQVLVHKFEHDYFNSGIPDSLVTQILESQKSTDKYQWLIEGKTSNSYIIKSEADLSALTVKLLQAKDPVELVIAEDITITKTIELPGRTVITASGNHTVSANTDLNSLIVVNRTTVLVLRGGKGHLVFDGKNKGGILEVYGTCTLEDGVTLTNGRRINGGGVYCTSPNVFIMNGGEITNCSTPETEPRDDYRVKNGGGAFFGNGFEMNGGKISKCSAYDAGGVSARTFKMNGGEISDCSAYNGGGVRALQLKMTGGTITKNTAIKGGGVSISNGYRDTYKFEMSGGLISNNTADYGGGVFFNGSDGEVLSAANGTISGNSAKNGGGIYSTNNTIKLENMKIVSNKAINGGGIFSDYDYSDKISIVKTEIIDNSAEQNGGGIVGGVKVTDSIIKGNTAGERGGGIAGSLIMYSGIITLNTANFGGGFTPYYSSKKESRLGRFLGNYAKTGEAIIKDNIAKKDATTNDLEIEDIKLFNIGNVTIGE